MWLACVCVCVCKLRLIFISGSCLQVVTLREGDRGRGGLLCVLAHSMARLLKLFMSLASTPATHRRTRHDECDKESLREPEWSLKAGHCLEFHPEELFNPSDNKRLSRVAVHLHYVLFPSARAPSKGHEELLCLVPISGRAAGRVRPWRRGGGVQ